MKRFLLAISLLFSVISYSQSFEVSSLITVTSQNGQIKGVILDKEFDNQPLAFTTIKIKDTNSSTSSDFDGSFSFDLKPGTYTLEVIFSGYKTVEIQNIKVNSNTTTVCNQILQALILESTLVVSQLK